MPHLVYYRAFIMGNTVLERKAMHTFAKAVKRVGYLSLASVVSSQVAGRKSNEIKLACGDQLSVRKSPSVKGLEA